MSGLDFSFLTWSYVSSFIVKGLVFSVELTLIAAAGGIVIGTLLALMRLSGQKALVVPATLYVNLLRSIPLAMVILWFFLIIPLLIGRSLGAELSAIITFTVFEAAYYSEVMRAGIQSVPKGQVNAGYAVGMTYRQCMQLIVLPQAFRNMLPVLLTQTIILFQDTSLVYVIGAYDLLKGFEVSGKNFNRPAETYLLAAVFYFVICFSLSLLVRRLRAQDRHHPLTHAAMTASSMIEIKNVSKWYGSFQVLTDNTTSIKKGEVVVVCGPSGSGKSTLIKTVNALEPIQKGDIVVDGTSISDPKTNLPEAPLAGRHGVPALRTVPAPVGHREPHARADQGAGAQPRRGEEARLEDARARRPDRPQGQVPGATLGRSAAACRDRPCAQHGSRW